MSKTAQKSGIFSQNVRLIFKTKNFKLKKCNKTISIRDVVLKKKRGKAQSKNIHLPVKLV